MKKIPILFLSILITSLFCNTAKPVSAAISENSTTWWSVEELLDFYQEVEAEKEAECGDNQECKMEFHFNMVEKGPKHSALNNLIEAQFWVTSINPETNTIKVLFFDEDMMMKYMGIEEKLEIEYLFISWTEEWVGHNYYHNLDNPTNEPISGVHQLINSEIQDISKIQPWYETELTMLDSDILDNTSGKLGYSVFAKDNKFNAQGIFDYSKCFRSSDYEPGIECKMYVSGDQWISFFPPREQIIEQDEQDTLDQTEDFSVTSEESIPEDTEITDNQETTEEGIATENVIETENNPEITEISSIQNQSVLTTKDTIKTPETGKNTEEFDYSVQIPWWVVALELLGISLMIWWFIPTKNKKVQKNLKKHGKTIDKKSRLR